MPKEKVGSKPTKSAEIRGNPRKSAWPRGFVVTPPAYGCRHPLLGEFKTGAGPRKVTFQSQTQVDEITKRDCPFTIQPAEE